jgi:REP element-mobilizing transposase RayT
MSRKYKFRNPDGIYFISFSVVGWVDLFTRDVYREILLDSFKYCQKEKGMLLHAFVIMTNHVHMIISRASEKVLLENIIRDLKKFTSGRIIIEIKQNLQESRKQWMLDIFRKAGNENSNNFRYQLWQQDNHPIELVGNKIMDQKLDYIHENPVKQGFVFEAEDYPWSSIHNYCGDNTLINIDLLE